ncbi:MAG: Lar family restriction alleviation protein [Bacteroidales bacterium]|nr:Lar family restriction alleviation protein [Bacteroidales bacterium]
MADLKSCPFCGGEGKIGKFMGRYSVHCCECLGSAKLDEIEEKAIEYWNRRCTDDRT